MNVKKVAASDNLKVTFHMLVLFAKKSPHPPYLLMKPRTRLFRMIKNHFQAESEGGEGKNYVLLWFPYTLTDLALLHKIFKLAEILNYRHQC